VLARSELRQLAKYKVFENIIAISNSDDEDASGSSDFSPRSIQRRMATGYADAKAKMNEQPPSASEVRHAVNLATAAAP
jgi:hypothetical protein